MLQATLRRLNLPGERLHALRAFFVTILLSGNVPVHVVRELVGHQGLATTQMYAAILAPDRGAAVGVLDRVYQGARGELPQKQGMLAARTEPLSEADHGQAARSLRCGQDARSRLMVQECSSTSRAQAEALTAGALNAISDEPDESDR